MVGRALSRRRTGTSGDASGMLAYAAFAVFTCAAFVLVQLEAPEPYMVSPARRTTALLPSASRLIVPPVHLSRWLSQDEPFHIPQAQQYCRGDFWTWDPKLTTPPGL